MSRALQVLCFCAVLGSAAHATPELNEQFVKLLGAKEGSRLSLLECAVCHTDPPTHNPYGRQVRRAVDAAGKEEITQAILAALAASDADGDGWPNGSELKQDTSPGDATSRPPGVPPTPEKAPAALRWLDRIMPKHSLHPTAVHFPIALFIFGVVLEEWSRRKSDDQGGAAAGIAMTVGAFASLFAILTGLLAFYRNGYGWSGDALWHAVAAGVATALMFVSCKLRKRAAEKPIPYRVSLFLAAIAVGLTGHLGGILVYGR